MKEFNKGYSKKYFREELPTDCFFIKVLLQNSSSSSSIKYGVLSTDWDVMSVVDNFYCIYRKAK